jgi:D-alanine-D-alanine ligase
MQRRVAVVMGGFSAEREVSLKSGKAIAKALREKGHDVVDVDLKDESVLPIVEAKPDVAFIALHGAYGEDGGIQGCLDEAGIAYTGSGVQASRAGMDKMASKCFFIAHEVATPPFRLVTTTQSWNEINHAIDETGLPLVVKPLRQGSSLGVSVARTREKAAVSLAMAFKYGHQALLERYIQGREFTVGVVDETPLPVIELKFARDLFDYDAKYADTETRYITQPELGERVYERLQELARAAHVTLGCRHFSRVDMMLEEDGSPYVLEVNTIPGFTERSLLPLAALEAGTSFPDLCERIVEMAVASGAGERRDMKVRM